jgi:hypothetical protein
MRSAVHPAAFNVFDQIIPKRTLAAKPNELNLFNRRFRVLRMAERTVNFDLIADLKAFIPRICNLTRFRVALGRFLMALNTRSRAALIANPNTKGPNILTNISRSVLVSVVGGSWASSCCAGGGVRVSSCPAGGLAADGELVSSDGVSGSSLLEMSIKITIKIINANTAPPMTSGATFKLI